MLNNSKRLLLSSNNSNYSAINDIKSNGKAKCYICIQESIEFSDDNIDIDLNKKDRIRLSKLVQGNKSYNNINFENSLISPCMCDINCHPKCIRKLIILNLSFVCKKCNTYYNLEYESKRLKICHTVKYFIYTLILIIFHISLFFIAFAFLLGYFNLSENYDILKYIIFIIILTLNIFLIILSVKVIIKRLNFEELNIKVLPYSKSNSEKIFTNKDLDKFSNFLGYTYNLSKLGIFEKKMSLKYYSYINKNKKRLIQYIKDNNNNNYYYINYSKKEKNIKNTKSSYSHSSCSKISQLGMVDEIKNDYKPANFLYTINEKDPQILDNLDKNLPFEKILQLRINKNISDKKISDSFIE